MDPLVSVILPTFNRAHSLAASMGSILNQSYREFELIVVDDGSTDKTESVVAAFADPRIRYVRLDRNRGVSAARNAGLAEARGQYIAFQDSDDIWLPGKLEKQVEILKAQPPEVGCVVGAKVLYGRDSSYTYGPGKVTYSPSAGNWLTLEEDQVARMLVENRAGPQLMLFRKECLPEMPCFDEVARANVDWGFAIRLVQQTLIYEDTEPVVYSSISTDSISKNMRNRAIGAIRILKLNRPLYNKYRKQYGRFIFDLGIILYRCGKKRAARNFILKSFAVKPYNIITALGIFIRKISINRLFAVSERQGIGTDFSPERSVAVHSDSNAPITEPRNRA